MSVSASTKTTSVGLLIRSRLEEVAREQNRNLAPLSDAMVLLEAGLDSLCLAIIVARLNDDLGCDPFRVDEDTYLPVTLGDFIKLYQDAAQ